MAAYSHIRPRIDRRSRGPKRPSFAVLFRPPEMKRAQGRPGAGWHPWSAAPITARANAQAENRWAGKHPAFPARCVDGLCLLSPGAEFLLASVTSRQVMHRVRLADASSRSLAVATTARTTWFGRTHQRRSSARSRDLTRFTRPGPASSCPAQPRPPHTPTHVRCDVRSPLSSGRDSGIMPQFRISVKRNISARGG